jgi:hypothetical protein
MKLFAKSRKVVSLVLCCVGVSLVMTTVSSLLRYREASEKYIGRVDLLAKLMSLPNPTSEEMDEQDRLLEFFHSKLTEDQFRQDVGEINRAIRASTTSQRSDLLLLIDSDLHSLRFRMESSQFLQHAELLILGGVGLFSLGLFLQKNNEPKLAPPASTIHAWDSVPPPTLAKSEAPTPQP